MAKTLSSVCRRECEWCILELGSCLPMAIGRKTPLLFDHLDTFDKLARVDALDSSNFKLARVHGVKRLASVGGKNAAG